MGKGNVSQLMGLPTMASGSLAAGVLSSRLFISTQATCWPLTQQQTGHALTCLAFTHQPAGA